jgi:esterase/lipase superfamily enzyme
VKVEEHHWPSQALGHEMWLKVYGHDGRPVIAFPSQDGRYWDWEGWGMIDAVGGLIEAGRLRLIAVDSIDWQSWTNTAAPPGDRARRHDAYDRYLATELMPFVTSLTGADRAWTTGASMGAFHAVNVVFRHPDLFDGLVAMSGLYRLRHFIGDYVDEAVYFNSPLHYLPGLEDPWLPVAATRIEAGNRRRTGRLGGGDARGHPRARGDPAGQGHPGHRRLLGPRR